MAERKPGRLAKAILETADALHRVGAMDKNTHARITLRHLGKASPNPHSMLLPSQ